MLVHPAPLVAWCENGERPPCCPHLSCAVMPLMVYLFRPPMTTCVAEVQHRIPMRGGSAVCNNTQVVPCASQPT